MASHTVAAGNYGQYDFTLTADTVDTVTFADDVGKVEVYSDGAASVFFTTNGTTPTVGGENGYHLPAAASSREVNAGSVVKLISAGTPKVSVSRV